MSSDAGAHDTSNLSDGEHTTSPAVVGGYNYIINHYEEDFMNILNSGGENLTAQQLMIKNKLHVLFMELDKEFDLILRDNEMLRARLEEYERLSRDGTLGAVPMRLRTPIPPPVKPKKNLGTIVGKGVATIKTIGKKDQTTKERKDEKDSKVMKVGMQKVREFMMAVNPNQKTAQQTKISIPVNKSITRRYLYHVDAVWQVQSIPSYSSTNPIQLIATASNDGTVCIWTPDYQKPILVYTGQRSAGASLNAVSFHPTRPIACSVSGDRACHIWRFADSLDMELYSPKLIEPKEEQREERSGSTLDVPTESHITNDDDANYENLNEDTDDEEFDQEDYAIENMNNIATQDLLSENDLISHSEEENNSDYEMDLDMPYDDEPVYISSPIPTTTVVDEFYCMENVNLFKNKPAQAGKRMAQIQPALHKSVVTTCDWSQWDQGSHIMTAGWDSQIRLFDFQFTSTTEVDESMITTITAPLRTFTGHDGPINDLRSAHSATMLVSGGNDGTVRLWDIRADVGCVSILKGHNNEPVSSAVFFPNDRFVVSGSDDGLLKIWDMRNLTKSVKSVHTHSGINDISISGYHSRISVALNKRQCKIYDLSGTCLATYQKGGHDLMVTGTAWSHDGLNVYTCSSDKQVIQWQFDPNMDPAEK